MKLSIAIFSAALGIAAAKKSPTKKSPTKRSPMADIKATSKVGSKLMSNARRLEDAEDEEIDFTWVANMSLKFQGCFHVSQWNEEADGDDDVRIETKRLVRFRLCPSDSCDIESAAGCSSGYGDYIIDMPTYLEAYFEAVEQDHEYNCEYAKENECGCDDDDGNYDDNFDAEICEYECYMGKGMEYCVDRNPYNDDEQEEEEEFDIGEYAECQQYEFENNDDGNNRRKLEEEAEYFVGPYCADQGGKIYLGLFTDDTCTQFADEYGGKGVFADLSNGKELPYSESTMVGSECMSCKEPEDADQNDDGDNEDADEVKESCEALYEGAGKCEAGLELEYANNNACNYMQGIKITRKNGTVVQGSASKNKTASVFIGLFAVSFVALGGYVYYLKTKLDRAKINLSE